MLGRELETVCTRRGASLLALGGRKDLDVTDLDRVREVLSAASPSTVINAAAYNDVDGAESEPDVADRVNRGGPANLARAV